MDAISRIAAIGDSIAWGQGLSPANKFANLVAASVGAPPLDDSLMVAHSGAIIGIHNPDSTSAIDNEIPVPAPMIIDELRTVPSPNTVDLVLLTGGINDVGLEMIVNPLTSLRYLRAATRQACYDDMRTLLGKVLGTFPTARVRVIGYFPILSPASDPLAGPSGDPLLHLLGNFNSGFPQTLEREVILEAVTARTMQFWTDSTSDLQQAVTNTANGDPRTVFVPAPFGPENAVFAPDPLLWGFAPDLGPEDEVARARGVACDTQYPSLLDIVADEICHHASVGHPNVRGAQRIAEAILATL
jgi:lysophospholipase L1-like esterase